jgi:transcriptional regulator with XRE-family HTH domain
MQVISKEALKWARKNKRLSQEELADAAKVDTSTISRMERGDSGRVRKHTLEQLAAALETKPEELCEVPKSEPDFVKLPMHVAARNALALVAKRYGVSRSDIVQLAPLLFYLAAEHSLSARRDHLGEIDETANSLEVLQSQMPHLPSLYPVDEEALRAERESIEARDLFGRRFANQRSFGERRESYEDNQHNPFAAFLTEALEKTRGPNDADEPVRYTTSCSPSYWICYDEAAEIVGGDEGAAWPIVEGNAALHEMPKGTPKRRAEWVRERSQLRAIGDFQDF